MLCYDEAGVHFYSRVSDLSIDFDNAVEKCIDYIVEALFPHQSVSLCASGSDILEVTDDVIEENLVTPLSNWDGLLTAELLMRPSNDHKILDLNVPCDRLKLSEAVGDMSFLDLHDAHDISLKLNDYPDGLLPDVPKMSISEMTQACKKMDATLLTIKEGVPTVMFQGRSASLVHYDMDNNRYSLNSARANVVDEISTLNRLKAIFWNCNSWDFQK